jgi:hypothetical protein
VRGLSAPGTQGQVYPLRYGLHLHLWRQAALSGLRQEKAGAPGKDGAAVVGGDMNGWCDVPEDEREAQDAVRIGRRATNRGGRRIGDTIPSKA